MFRKLFRWPRTIRVPVDHDRHNIQQVRIYKSAQLKPSNFVTTFFAAYFLFRLLESTDVFKSPRKTVSERFGKTQTSSSIESGKPVEVSEHWKRAHAEIQRQNEGSIPVSATNTAGRTDSDQLNVLNTIILPIWIREKKGRLYEPSDPEYKEFVRLQSDKERIAKLKKTAGEWALSRLKSPIHEANLRYIGFQGQVAVVLDLVPQVRIPHAYELPALRLKRDSITFEWLPMASWKGERWSAVLQPRATYGAAKAGFKAFLNTTYYIVTAKINGIHSTKVSGQGSRTNKSSTPSAVASAQPSTLGDKDLARDNATPDLSNFGSSIPNSQLQALIRANHGGSGKEQHAQMLANMPFGMAVKFAVATFRRQQLVGAASLKQTKTRGVVQVKGAIVCMGSRGKYRLDVVAFYQPSDDTFIGPLIVSNAYVVKDYSRWQAWHDEQARRKRDAANSSRSSDLPQNHEGKHAEMHDTDGTKTVEDSDSKNEG